MTYENWVRYSNYPAMLNKLHNLLESLELTPYQIRIFLSTFIAMAVIVGMQHLGFHSPIPFLSLDK